MKFHGIAESSKSIFFTLKSRQKSGAPGGARTHHLLLRRQSLYPNELRVHRKQTVFNITQWYEKINPRSEKNSTIHVTTMEIPVPSFPSIGASNLENEPAVRVFEHAETVLASGRLMCRTCRDSAPGRSVHYCRIHDSGDDGALFRIRIHGRQTAWHGTSDFLHLARCCRLLIVDDVPLNLSVPKALLKKVGVNDVETAVLMPDEKRTASSAPESASAPEAKDSGG